LAGEVAEMQPEIVAAFIGVGGAVLASAISYQLGKRQSVDQDLRDRRIEVTTEVLSKIHEISTGFEDIEKTPFYWDDEQRNRLYAEVSRRVDELANYYASNKPWLPEEARTIVEACIADIRGWGDSDKGWEQISDHLQIRHGGFDQKFRNWGGWSPTLIKETADNLRKRRDDLDRYFSSSVLDTHRPWWRRFFGR
jgi:hypothetical protein